MAYDNELKGVLFKNTEKEKETQPDYRGDAQIDGVSYFMDAWINTAESGRKYMSVKFKAKEKQPTRQAAPAQRAPASKPTAKTGTGFDDMDSDCPF